MYFFCYPSKHRSSRPVVFCARVSFLIKLQADARCFPVNCVKLLTPLFREHLRWLLLKTGCLTGTLIVKNLSNHLKVY